jgi:hypothetical protein
MLAASPPNPCSILALIILGGLALVALFLALHISAFILKLSCRVCGVDEPDTGKAMVVSFLESFVGGAVYVASLVTAIFIGKAVNAHQTTMTAFAGLSAVSVTFLVPAGIYMPMLRVTFQKGLVVSILRYVITFVLLAGLALILLAIVGIGKMKPH